MLEAPPLTVDIVPPARGFGQQFHFAIDAPRPNQVYESLTVNFRGFVLRLDRSLPLPRRLVFMIDGREVWECAIELPRPDVVSANANRTKAIGKKDLYCGFDSVLPSFLGARSGQVIDVVVRFDRRNSDCATPPVNLCGIRFNLRGQYPKSEGAGTIVINSIGRSGSSLISRILGMHPMIYTPTLHGQHGEVFVLGYFARALAALSSEGAHALTNRLQVDSEFISLPPGHFRLDDAAGGLEPELGATLGAMLFRHVCKMHSEALTAVTAYVAKRKPSACFWLEKSWNNPSLNLLRAMNPTLKEILLVRNPFDFWASQELFHRKIGSPTAERRRHVQATFQKYKALFSAINDRRDLACLVRYEDLITSPETAITRIFDYLNIELTPEFLDAACRMVRDGGEFQQKMRTDGSGESFVAEFESYVSEMPAQDRNVLNAFCKFAGYQ